jgi:hypothetical protein
MACQRTGATPGGSPPMPLGEAPTPGGGGRPIIPAGGRGPPPAPPPRGLLPGLREGSTFSPRSSEPGLNL